ncbi:hypothetical protein EV126DRAFT_62289 [Verticillium dahliae]|nr:hypothetical protein EV126DRAFT_62289 [Verticillium dahliae]
MCSAWAVAACFSPHPQHLECFPSSSCLAPFRGSDALTPVVLSSVLCFTNALRQLVASDISYRHETLLLPPLHPAALLLCAFAAWPPCTPLVRRDRRVYTGSAHSSAYDSPRRNLIAQPHTANETSCASLWRVEGLFFVETASRLHLHHHT